MTIRPPSDLLRAIGASDRVQSVPAGFSGAQVFRVATATGDRAVKAWPQATKIARIAGVHRVQRLAGDLAPALDTFGQASVDASAAAPRRPVGITPPERSAAQTWVSSGRRLWESATWLPGTPLPVDAPIGDVLLGIDAIAAIHRRIGEATFEGPVSTPLARRPTTPPAVPAAITDRILYADRLARRIPELARRIPKLGGRGNRIAGGSPGAMELESTLDQAVDWFRRGGPRAMRRISQAMNQHAGGPAELRMCLRDVHREHILFESGSVGAQPLPSGVLDWDALRWDTPATDLARWMGSFSLAEHRTDEIASAAMDRYLADPSSSRAFSGVVDASLVADLIRATAWISLGQWCVWLALDKRPFEVSPQRLARRIRFWIDQLIRRDDFA